MKQLQKNTTRIFGALLLVAAFLIAIPASAQDETDDELLNFLIEFNTALDNIVSDYPNNFKNVLGAEKPAEEGQSQQYESQIGLPDEERSYFTKTLSGGDKLTFVSVYGEYPDSTQAYELYAGLSLMLSLFTFQCCEMDLVTSRNDVYMAMTQLFPKGNPAGYENMEIRVAVFKSFDMDGQLNITDKYVVVLNVRPKDV